MTAAMEAAAITARGCYSPGYYSPASQPAQRSSMDSLAADGMASQSLQGQPLPDKIFVGGLSEKTSEQDLREIFGAHADVKTVKIITDKSVMSKNGDPRRYAFVEFHCVADAKKVLNHFLPENVEETPNVELHGRRLNIGCAFKKTPTFGRVFGPTVMSPVMNDPYSIYAAQWPFMQGPKSPMGMQPSSPYYPYSMYSGFPVGMCQPGSPPAFMYQQSPSNFMPQRSFSNQSGPTPALPGGLQSSSNGVPAMTPHMAYQLASTMLQQMHNTPQNSPVDPDGSYLNSSSNSGSSRNGGSDRSADRFQYGGSGLTQLPSGHMEQRERNGRIMNIPQPVRLPEGPAPGSPFMAGNGMTGYMPGTPGMRHAFVQN